MITRTNAFVTSDQQTFAELDAAIGHELKLLFPADNEPASGVVETILKNRERIVDLLTTTATSKSRARKVNGGSKKRATKPDVAAVNRALQDGAQ